MEAISVGPITRFKLIHRDQNELGEQLSKPERVWVVSQGDNIVTLDEFYLEFMMDYKGIEEAGNKDEK